MKTDKITPLKLEEYKVYPPASANMHVIGNADHEVAYTYSAQYAAYIVKAANLYPELVEALKRCSSELQIFLDHTELEYKNIAIELAKAVLEKARE